MTSFSFWLFLLGQGSEPSWLSGAQVGCCPHTGLRPPLASLSAGLALVCNGVTVHTPAFHLSPLLPSCLPSTSPHPHLSGFAPYPPLLQPLGPSSSASSSQLGRAAWASTWPRQTRLSSTTQTGIRTMTSRSVALTPKPPGLLTAPSSVGLPRPMSQDFTFSWASPGDSQPQDGPWEVSGGFAYPSSASLYKGGNRPREGGGCVQGYTAIWSLSHHPQDQDYGGEQDEGVSPEILGGPVWEGTRRTEWGDKACWRLGRGRDGGGGK